MVGLASLPYRFFSFMPNRAQTRPGKLTIQSLIQVPKPSKLTKRKNYLRPKILKTPTKPYPIPLPTPEDPLTPMEPSVVGVPSESISENLDSGVVEQSEKLVTVDESNSAQFEAVQAVSEVQNVVSVGWFSGRMMVKIVASFVGLFVLQTVVSVWMMGGDSDEKDRNLGIEGQGVDGRLGIRKVVVGVNGDALQGNLAYLNVDDSEIEAKIAEIRKMAREARELEKMNLKNDETDMSDVSDDDEDDGLGTEASRLRSGIVKEVDGRLTKLRKNAPAPLLNVNILNKAPDPVKKEGLKAKEENNMLMFEMKDRLRNHMTAPRDKPKGFQSIKSSHVMRQKPTNLVDEQAIKTGNQSGSNASSTDENRRINSIDSSFPDKSSSGSQIDEKKIGSGSSSPLLTLKKGFGNNGGARKLNKKINKGAKSERGVVQDSSPQHPVDQEANAKYSSTITTQNSQMKMKDTKTSATSEMRTSSVPLSSDELGSTPSKRKIKDMQQIGDSSPWWSALPYVLVVLMQKGHNGEALEGFYTLRIDSDFENRPHVPYIVAFEASGDARNFSYILESVFGDLPDANIDIVPLSTKELKLVAESSNNEVIVVKKGELRLYAGQPVDEVEAALRSLVK